VGREGPLFPKFCGSLRGFSGPHVPTHVLPQSRISVLARVFYETGTHKDIYTVYPKCVGSIDIPRRNIPAVDNGLRHILYMTNGCICNSQRLYPSYTEGLVPTRLEEIQEFGLGNINCPRAEVYRYIYKANSLLDKVT